MIYYIILYILEPSNGSMTSYTLEICYTHICHCIKYKCGIWQKQCYKLLCNTHAA